MKPIWEIEMENCRGKSSVKNSKESAPFTTLWNILSVPLSVIGLASLSETLVQWDDFILQLLESYRALTYPVFKFLFGWIPFSIPTWVYDYLTLGVIVEKSIGKATWVTNEIVWKAYIQEPGFTIMSIKLQDSPPSWKTRIKWIIENTFFYLTKLILYIAVWPLRLLIVATFTSLLFPLFFSTSPVTPAEKSKLIKNITLQWISAIFLSFSLLLIINYSLSKL